jgi:uncharacterized membrane protein
MIEEKIIKINGSRAQTVLSLVAFLNSFVSEFMNFKMSALNVGSGTNRVTVAGIAKEIGINYNQLNNYINGNQRMSADCIEKIMSFQKRVSHLTTVNDWFKNYLKSLYESTI